MSNYTIALFLGLLITGIIAIKKDKKFTLPYVFFVVLWSVFVCYMFENN